MTDRFADDLLRSEKIIVEIAGQRYTGKLESQFNDKIAIVTFQASDGSIQTVTFNRE